MADTELAKHIANGIKSYATGESEAYNYHGDGSAHEAMSLLYDRADSISQWILKAWGQRNG